MTQTHESGEVNGDNAQEEYIDRHLKDFGLPAFGDKRMLKSLLRHYPDIDLSTMRIAKELGVTHALMMNCVEEHLRPVGLSWSKLIILIVLRGKQENQGKGLNPSELSDRLVVSRNTISTLLAGLENQGYISRELDPEDKRRFVIRLTPAGNEAVEKCSGAAFSHLQTLLSTLDEEQRITLVQLLTQIQRTVIQSRPDLAARCPHPAFRPFEE